MDPRNYPNTYSSSAEYVLKKNKDFHYPTYYNNFCQGCTREQTQSKIKEDIENSLYNFDSTVYDPSSWLNEQLKNDLPVVKTELVDDFWIMMDHKQVSTLTKRLDLSFQKQQLIRILDTQLPPTQSSSLATAVQNVIEADTSLVFNNRSIGSIIKSYGATQFNQYLSLEKDEKSFVAFCLNGIIDFTSHHSQYSHLFTKGEWKIMETNFKKPIKHLYKFAKSELEILKKIEKYISKGKYTKAYNKCLKMIIKSTGNTHMYKILAHIINCYLERSDVFTSSSCTEMDYLAKVWTEIFELLFAKEDVKVKWGESTSQKTTEAKLSNNGNMANTIGLKVDARFITQSASNETIDLINLEASKDTNDYSKIIADKLKLAIESKVIVDEIVNFLPDNHKMKYVVVQNIQVSGLQAEICSLKLVDAGLYIYDVDFDISLPHSIVSFGSVLIDWLRKLFHFRQSVLSNAAIITSMPIKENQTFDEAFRRSSVCKQPTDDKFVSRSWTRGTFFTPTTRRPTPTMPANFLAPPISTKRKANIDISPRPSKQ